MRDSLSRMAQRVEVLTTYILLKIYKRWKCYWMTGWVQFLTGIESGTCKFNSCDITLQQHFGELPRCCIGYDLTLELGWTQIFRLCVQLSIVTSATIIHVCLLIAIKVWAFMHPLNGALDLVCLRFMGPSSPVLCCLNRVLRGLSYPVCTAMARPQQVWVRMQGKGGLGNVPEQRPNHDRRWNTPKLALANSLNPTPAQLCLKSVQSGKRGRRQK